MDSWSPGMKLGPYELLALIGAGGMGEVWKARDVRLDRFVAVKRMAGQHGERFRREALALAALNHPHVCQVHDAGPDYLVLEYIEGDPVLGPLPVDQAIRNAIRIAEALEAAHARGIIHRDLKPANILLSRSGTIKLLDFGLAKLADSPTQTGITIEGSIIGTPAYMSPEQVQGKPPDQRSDIFSFGAVLYEMLSGNRAFDGATAAQALSAVLFADPPPLAVSRALQSILRRCLAKKPEDRFPTIGEVRRTLEALSSSPAPNSSPSIAVLPFSTMTADKEDEYFSDGLAEEIINALAHIPGLKVTARTSSFSFRGKDLDIPRVAEALQVRTVLEGSVRRSGSRIRVTAQLIDAESGYHIWSERYDREMSDVFALQDDIAQAIAAALKVQLSSRPDAAHPTSSVPAYEAFLKARYFLRKGTPDAYRQGREHLEQAIALDPHFALAHAELASCYRLLTMLGDEPTREGLWQARGAARRALEIDPMLPEAHAQEAAVAVFLDYDWRAAGEHFAIAIAQEPIPSDVSHLYGFFYLLPAKSAEDALREMERSLAQDPLNLECLTQCAVVLWTLGRNQEAATLFQQVHDLDANFWLGACLFALWHSHRGDFDAGFALAQRAYAIAPKIPSSIGLLAGFLSRTGDTDRAQSLLQLLGDGTSFGAALALSIYHVVRHEWHRAADWIDLAIEQHNPNVLPASCGPFRCEYEAIGRWNAMAQKLRLATNSQR